MRRRAGGPSEAFERHSIAGRRWGVSGVAVAATRGSSIRRALVLAVLVSGVIGTASAAPSPEARSPEVRCAARTLAAAADALACHAGRTAHAADTLACSRALANRLARIDERLGDCCDAAGATAAVESEVRDVVAALSAILADADARCRAATLVAAAAMARCELRVARRTLRARPTSTDCAAVFAARLRRADRRGASACRAVAARAGATALVRRRVDELVALATDAVTTTSTSVTSTTTPPTTTTTAPETCGNGTVEVPEECDDGARVDGDGCAAACTLEDVSALCAGVPSTGESAVRAVRVTGDLDRPIGIAAPRLDPARLFVVEQPGRIRLVEHGVLQAEPFLDVHELVSFGGEQGLLGLAFHPDYETNGRFFVSYNDVDGDTVIARYRVDPLDPRRADTASGQVLLRVVQPYANHNGGHLAFGPDGYLYAGRGDGGGAGDPLEAAQDDASLLGKLLRLDVDVETPPYWTVPPSNPRYDGGRDPLELVWAKGLRNPWRFSFDRGTGDLWIGDVGQGELEEIDWQPASSPGGENYGWDVFEGSACYEPDPDPVCPSPPVGFTFPVHEYGHDEGCSVTGGFVYRGCALPALHGRYFYADYCAGFVRSFALEGGVAGAHLDHSAALDPTGELGIGRIASFGEDARGELYVVDVSDGELFRIIPASWPAP
jgi:cysteine-rich repeat protein